MQHFKKYFTIKLFRFADCCVVSFFRSLSKSLSEECISCILSVFSIVLSVSFEACLKVGAKSAFHVSCQSFSYKSSKLIQRVVFFV